MMSERLKPCLRVIRPTLALVLAAASFSSTFAGPLDLLPKQVGDKVDMFEPDFRAFAAKDELDNGIRAWIRLDYATAMRLLRPLAERGNARAQTFVGTMYEYGQGVQQNFVQAAPWYRKAAEQGDDLAQSNLGLLYEIGGGVPQNYALAMKWTLMAAKQGNFAAQSAMSSFYKLDKKRA